MKQKKLLVQRTFNSSRWKDIKGLYLEKKFKFNNYNSVIDFVCMVADIAHIMDHHPELTFNYDTANIRIWTHKVNNKIVDKITDLDHIFAEKVDSLI
ncbi:MAG: 4a-hydroxytetrahydrobiopterin dehydratase [Candidatus Woesearchaeota archaeon]